VRDLDLLGCPPPRAVPEQEPPGEQQALARPGRDAR
jgi:hypothetical protein